MEQLHDLWDLQAVRVAAIVTGSLVVAKLVEMVVRRVLVAAAARTRGKLDDAIVAVCADAFWFSMFRSLTTVPSLVDRADRLGPLRRFAPRAWRSSTLNAVPVDATPVPETFAIALWAERSTVDRLHVLVHARSADPRLDRGAARRRR